MENYPQAPNVIEDPKYSHNFELILAANREGANKHDTYRVSSGATITRQIYS